MPKKVLQDHTCEIKLLGDFSCNYPPIKTPVRSNPGMYMVGREDCFLIGSWKELKQSAKSSFKHKIQLGARIASDPPGVAVMSFQIARSGDKKGCPHSFLFQGVAVRCSSLRGWPDTCRIGSKGTTDLTHLFPTLPDHIDSWAKIEPESNLIIKAVNFNPFSNQ